MLKSESLKSKLKFQTARASLPVLCLLAAFLTLLASAFGQNTPDFTLDAAKFNHPTVEPGEAATSNITVGSVNDFTGAVDLSCTVSPQQTAPAVSPECEVSPTSVSPGDGATATVTTNAATPATYTITITGTSGALTHTAQLNLSVLQVAPQFTITVETAVVPSSVPAGNAGTGVISINPINGYKSPGYPTEGVTLSCSSITPLVTIPPVCSFNPPSPPVNGTPVTSTITISAYGPQTTGAVVRPRGFYALWLPLPMLALAGVGAAVGGKRSRKAWGLLALFVVSGALLLMPACGNNGSTTTTTPNGITPANTYTFTVTGVDSAGNTSSNTRTSTTAPTVSLTVTAPTT